MNDLHLVNYRQMQPADETSVIDLVSRVFSQFVAPLYADEGVAEFMKYIEPSTFAERAKAGHFILLAELNDEIIGVIETRENKHIALFFVAAEYQHKGIGRALLKRAEQVCITNNPELEEITVNASPNAVAAYKALGFSVKGEENTVNGIRSLPMVFALTD